MDTFTWRGGGIRNPCINIRLLSVFEQKVTFVSSSHNVLDELMDTKMNKVMRRLQECPSTIGRLTIGRLDTSFLWLTYVLCSAPVAMNLTASTLRGRMTSENPSIVRRLDASGVVWRMIFIDRQGRSKPDTAKRWDQDKLLEPLKTWLGNTSMSGLSKNFSPHHSLWCWHSFIPLPLTDSKLDAAKRWNQGRRLEPLMTSSSNTSMSTDRV